MPESKKERIKRLSTPIEPNYSIQYSVEARQYSNETQQDCVKASVMEIAAFSCGVKVPEHGTLPSGNCCGENVAEIIINSIASTLDLTNKLGVQIDRVELNDGYLAADIQEIPSLRGKVKTPVETIDRNTMIVVRGDDPLKMHAITTVINGAELSDRQRDGQQIVFTVRIK